MPARPRRRAGGRSPTEGMDGGGDEGEDDNKLGVRIFVGNLKRPIQDDTVRAHFERHGEVVAVDLRRGYGFVRMKHASEAENAVKCRWQVLDWRVIEVFLYKPGLKGSSWVASKPPQRLPLAPLCDRCALARATHVCPTCRVKPCSGCEKVCMKCARGYCSTCSTSYLAEDASKCVCCSARELPEAARTYLTLRSDENSGNVYGLVNETNGFHQEALLIKAVTRASKTFVPRPNASGEAMSAATQELRTALAFAGQFSGALRGLAQDWLEKLNSVSAELMKSNAADVDAGSDEKSEEKKLGLTHAIKRVDQFLCSFEPRAESYAEGLISGLQQAASRSKTNKRVQKRIDEFIERVRVWTRVLSRFMFDEEEEASPKHSTIDGLNRAMRSAETFFLSCKSPEAFASQREGILRELVVAGRAHQRSGGSVELLKHASRLARHMEARVVQWATLQRMGLPFHACYHYHVGNACKRGKLCTFAHGERVPRPPTASAPASPWGDDVSAAPQPVWGGATFAATEGDDGLEEAMDEEFGEFDESLLAET